MVNINKDTISNKIEDIAKAVEQYLNFYFAEFKHKQSLNIFPDIPNINIVDEVIDLTVRGGKRLRSTLVVSGYELFKENGRDNTDIIKAAAAIELLQTYFLIHDDIMDEDRVRRGGKSVHVSLQDKTGNRKIGTDLGILAGDMANAMAFNLITQLEYGGKYSKSKPSIKAERIFSRMHMDVVGGQALDILNGDPYETVIRKTASYTTIGPLCIGAALGEASDSQLKDLAQIGRDIGIAFQYRDDLIGLFEKSSITGKPIGSDLKNCKNTMVLNSAFSIASSDQKNILENTLGNHEASEEMILKALKVIVDTGAKKRCESEIEKFAKRAVKNIKRNLKPQGRGLFFLEELIYRLAFRKL